MCPHILRYLTTAVITNKDVRKRRQVLKDLVKVIQQVSSSAVCGKASNAARGLSRQVNDVFSVWMPQESYTYKDPITEFVECLYVNFDFDSAQKKLRECESVSATSRTTVCVCLSWCTDLNWPMKVSHLLGLRADGKPLSATALWSPESPAFNFAAIQPQQIHVWPDLPAPNFIQCDIQSGTAVRFWAWLPFLCKPLTRVFVVVLEDHFASTPGSLISSLPLFCKLCRDCSSFNYPARLQEVGTVTREHRKFSHSAGYCCLLLARECFCCFPN